MDLSKPLDLSSAPLSTVKGVVTSLLLKPCLYPDSSPTMNDSSHSLLSFDGLDPWAVAIRTTPEP